MWFRFVAISFVKWFILLMVNSLLLRFILPAAWRGYALSFPLWLVAFVIAFLFAEWAFSKRLPDSRDVWTLLASWMVVTATLDILQALFVLGNIYAVINSPDIYIQYLLEILAILLAARSTRRRKIGSVLAEGMRE